MSENRRQHLFDSNVFLTLDLLWAKEEVDPYYRARKINGEFYRNYEEQRQNPDKFYDYTRMSVETFDYILETIKSDLESGINPKSFRGISPAEKLYITLGSSCGGVSLGAQLVCAKTPGLTDKQRAMCRAAPAAMAAISDGLRMAYAECVSQMRGRRWNCSGVGDGKHFNHVISMATKEAAYTYAITSAGVTHALSAACSAGELPACGCNNRRRGLDSPSWQWGGGRCGEGARGARLARRFLDARELEHDARALMNLHNNRLGRKVFQMVKEQVVKECKCHGVSGSCSVRTCWRALPPFNAVAGVLTQKYLRARKVAAVERGATLDGRVNLQLVVKKSQKSLSMSRPPRKSELVYLAPSPPYCEPAPAAAALGTHQRRCNQTSRGEESCSHLCCGRGHSTLHVTSRVQCRCSFHWCCKVHCDTCTVTTEHHICN